MTERDDGTESDTGQSATDGEPDSDLQSSGDDVAGGESVDRTLRSEGDLDHQDRTSPHEAGIATAETAETAETSDFASLRPHDELPASSETDLAVPVDPIDDPIGAVRETIFDDVMAFFESAAADPATGRRAIVTSDDQGPSREFVEEHWFDLSHLSEYELIEWTWLNRPYSLVSILYNEDHHRYRYHVSEPTLNSFERYVRDDLIRIIRNSLLYEDIDDTTRRTAIFTDKVGEIIAEHAATIDPGSVQKLFYYFVRDFLDFGRVDPLMRDGAIEDISCDGVDVPVFIYHRRFRDLRTNVTFEREQLNSFAVRLAQRAGKHLSISNPLVDASLDDGSRIQITLGTDISTRGTNFTIRKFSEVPFSPINLIEWNTFSVDQMAYFWLAIENNKSLIFAGGTGSGKTTSMNAVSFCIPPDSKVVSIEDTREITLPHENWIQSVTRESASATGQGEVSTYDLLQAALRQRPEYLLVGEIRTEQRVALTFFQAIGTGHTAYTTVHADSMDSFLARLRNPPLSVPTQMIQNLDIVCIQRQVFKDGGRVRRTEQVSEILPAAYSGEIETRRIFERDAATDTHEKVGESAVLQSIADQRGWSEQRLETELDDRRRVLQYLVDRDITDYYEVAATIHTFARDPESVLERIEADDLRPDELELVP